LWPPRRFPCRGDELGNLAIMRSLMTSKRASGKVLGKNWLGGIMLEMDHNPSTLTSHSPKIIITETQPEFPARE
jgi:hypothetical protein